MTMKSSLARHRMVSTGKVCRLANRRVFRSRIPRIATEWSWATEQIHEEKRGCKNIILQLKPTQQIQEQNKARTAASSQKHCNIDLTLPCCRHASKNHVPATISLKNISAS